jgi:Cell Wall Hydrolase
MLSLASRLHDVRLPTMERRHWLASFVMALMLGLYLTTGLSIYGVGTGDGRAIAKVGSLSSRDPALQTAPPQPEPLAFREVAPEDAVAINASVPIANLPNPAARSFAFLGGGFDRMRALECLTAAVYYEAAVETLDGQRAVAQVVLNRVRHPAYPRSVCGVVFQGSQRATGCQFTFTCDGSLGRTPSAAGWQRARQVAAAALAGQVYAPVGHATHYHTDWVVPYWSSSLVKVANIGTHIFYRWTGGWGTPAAFRHRHAGAEPVVSRSGDAKAAVEGELAPVIPGDVVDAAAAAEADPAANASIDSFQRAVLRRYEPLRKAAEASNKAALARTEVATAHRWALTGEDSGPAAAPLGKKEEVVDVKALAAKQTAKPAEPKKGTE